MYIIREYGSTLYVGMAWKKMAAHTFQLYINYNYYRFVEL